MTLTAIRRVELIHMYYMYDAEDLLDLPAEEVTFLRKWEQQEFGGY